VAILVGIVLLLRGQHGEYLAQQQRAAQALLPLKTVQEYFPLAHSTAASTTLEQAQDAFNAEGELLGTLFQTSPQADHILGFSGPTNVLIACDPESRIVRVSILHSRDTREHVFQVQQDPRFMQQYVGKKLSEVRQSPPAQVVSGATLTSLAITESILKRLGAKPRSLKFAEPVTLADAQVLYPAAAKLLPDAGEPSMIRVRDAQELPLGWMLRTSPTTDNTVGYQGPTDTLIGFGSDGKILGVAVRKSYDNEPYVGYVRDDTYFREYFNGKTLSELAGIEFKQSGVEGVSGATMTSMAVTKGILLAAQQHQSATQVVKATPEKRWPVSLSDAGTLLMIAVGCGIGLTNLRGQAWFRLTWQILVMVYLGFINGALLSQALFVGWSQTGVPLGAVGLIVLSAAALVVPITTKRNVYCSHLCPHGAVQQIALKFARPRWNPSPKWKPWLQAIPGLLLVWCVLVGMLHWGFSLVDIEPFDAYLFRIAGGTAITLAVVGIVASCFSPMAYCRYGCPTGAMLEFVRHHARADEWSRRDWFATGLFLLALVLYWVQ
jgi:transcriptional regulator of nitric oxide reductase